MYNTAVKQQRHCHVRCVLPGKMFLVVSILQQQILVNVRGGDRFHSNFRSCLFYAPPRDIADTCDNSDIRAEIMFIACFLLLLRTTPCTIASKCDTR